MSRLQGFFSALLCSFVLLASSHFVSASPLTALFGLLPLAIYHAWLWRAESLTQQEIDSVYYFGFILTLTTLGLSAFGLANSGGSANDINSIGTQFALGLLATGYGLIARITLQGKRLSLDNVDEAFDRQLDQVGRLVREFGNTIDLFKGLKEEAIRGAVQGASGASAEIVRLVSRDLEGPIKSLHESLINLESAFSVLSPDQLRGIGESTLVLKQSLNDLSEQAPILTREFRLISTEVQSISEKQTEFGKAVAALSTAAAALTEHVQIHGRVAEISSVSFQRLERASSEATRSLLAIGEVDSSVVESVSQQLHFLSQSLARVLGNLHALASQIEAAGKAQEGLVGSTSVTKGAILDLSNEVTSAQNAMSNFAPNLSVLNDALSSSSEQLKALSKIDLSALDGLGASLQALSVELLGVNKALGESSLSLPAKIEDVHSELAATSEKMKREAEALSESTELLGGAMQRMAVSLRSSIDSISN